MARQQHQRASAGAPSAPPAGSGTRMPPPFMPPIAPGWRTSAECVAPAYVPSATPHRSYSYKTSKGFVNAPDPAEIDEEWTRSILISEETLLSGQAFASRSSKAAVAAMPAQQRHAWERWVTAASRREPVRVVSMGDSLLAGGADYGAYPYRFARELHHYLADSATPAAPDEAGGAAKLSPVQFVNIAKGGTPTEAELPLFGPNLDPFLEAPDGDAPTLLIIDHTINDGMHCRGTVRVLSCMAALEVLVRQLLLVPAEHQVAVWLIESRPQTALSKIPEIYGTISSRYGVAHLRFANSLRGPIFLENTTAGWGPETHPDANTHQLLAEVLLASFLSTALPLCWNRVSWTTARDTAIGTANATLLSHDARRSPRVQAAVEHLHGSPRGAPPSCAWRARGAWGLGHCGGPSGQIRLDWWD